eukprot:maker-scaffold_35-snap-gene-2.98-mRNA-1 protein AED:0.01 eAED:0.01 QI:73/1/1/1/1/1/3/51/340
MTKARLHYSRYETIFKKMRLNSSRINKCILNPKINTLLSIDHVSRVNLHTLFDEISENNVVKEVHGIKMNQQDVTSACFTKDKLIIGGSRGLEVFDIKTRKKISEIVLAKTICVSNQNFNVFVGSESGVYLVDIETEKILFLDTKYSVSYLSLDEEHLFCASQKGAVQLFNARTKEKICEAELQNKTILDCKIFDKFFYVCGRGKDKNTGFVSCFILSGNSLIEAFEFEDKNFFEITQINSFQNKKSNFYNLLVYGGYSRSNENTVCFLDRKGKQIEIQGIPALSFKETLSLNISNVKNQLFVSGDSPFIDILQVEEEIDILDGKIKLFIKKLVSIFQDN